MKTFYCLWIIGILFIFTVSSAFSVKAATAELIHQAENTSPTAAYKWLDILLEASAREVDRHKARPTILSRAMAIVLTSMYDAWAAYDDKAVGTRLGGTLRRPAEERTVKNKEIAIAYGAYRSLLSVYPDDSKWLGAQMKKMGFDPDDQAADTKTAAGIGNIAAAAVIAYRAHDGANQLGDEPGSDGKPYSDYSGYKPKNTPDHIVDPNTWTAIEFTDPEGKKFTPGFLTPFWGNVKPFALKSGDQFRAGPPPLFESPDLKKEVQEVMDTNASLTLEQKAVVEFMRDGPRSTAQSGHWLRFAQDVSRRDHLTLDQDIKLFFSVGNVVFDAFIGCWDTKRFYDTSRPYWWVRLYHKGEHIRGWAGPGKGVSMIPAEKWHPYSPDTFITPPFPGYASGHANASGAASKILELFTGSDHFGATAVWTVGSLTEAKFTTAQMQSVDGKPATDVSESKEIKLSMPTFSATAEMAAISRMWGGYHIRSDNEQGLKMGREIAEYSWPIYQSYFNGTAKAP